MQLVKPLADIMIKPCPFCGAEVSLQARANSKLVLFYCDPEGPCGGSWLGTYGHADHMESAIAAWNTRVDYARIGRGNHLEALLEALQGMIALDEARDLVPNSVHAAARAKAQAAIARARENDQFRLC